MSLTKEDVQYIVAPLKGTPFLAAMLGQANERRCDRCQIQIEYGSLCRRCSRAFDATEEVR